METHHWATTPADMVDDTTTDCSSMDENKEQKPLSQQQQTHLEGEASLILCSGGCVGRGSFATVETATSTAAAAAAAAMPYTQEEIRARSEDVKQRIGPIVNRLKASLAKIQHLEDSMQLGEEATAMKTAEKGNHKEDTLGDNKGSTIETQLTENRRLVAGAKSCHLMQDSMEMVKRKLLRLKSIEHTLAESEDRREYIQHQLLQISVDSSTKEALQGRVDKLEQEVTRLEAKCQTVDDLQARNVVLYEQTQDVSRLRQQVVEVTVERDNLQVDLVERQDKIQAQAIRCDELECQVESLTAMCDELVASLKYQEDRTASLEEELVETRKLLAAPLVRSNSHGSGGPPRMIHSTVSFLSGDSCSGTRSMSHDDNDSSSSSSSPAEAEKDNNNNALDVKLQECVANSSRSTLLALGDGAVNSPEALMIQNLIAKVEALDRENAELRESKHHALGKFRQVGHEMARQASLIQELQIKLDDKRILKDGTTKMGKGSDMALCVLPAASSPKGSRGGGFLQRLPKFGGGTSK